MSTSERKILHIIYIHGFQGDHTSFQSFPTDLHSVLETQLAAHIELRSILYPTYESRRSIGVATENFLNWLDKLPDGPLILCGHSMGGLLAAEAATSPTHKSSKRVVGLIAFDVPFLGMHPHVVKSGLASLIPKRKAENGKLKTESQMNDATRVDIPGPSRSELSLENQPQSAGATHSPPPLPPRPPRPSPSPISSPSGSSSPKHSSFSKSLQDFIHSHANDPLVTFLTQHRSESLKIAMRLVVESFEFGICMFDPKGLVSRYEALEKWNGQWVAYWTETVPKNSGHIHEEVGDDIGLDSTSTASDVVSPPPSSTSSSTSTLNLSALSKDRKSREKDTKTDKKHREKMHSPHHFVVTPFRGTDKWEKFINPFRAADKWEKVVIANAKDEVEAHCGLFLRNTNASYDVFVERVAGTVKNWAF